MKKSNFKFNLGDKVEHKLIPFDGIIRGRYEYLTGCRQYGVQNQTLNKDDEPRKWHTFDENMLQLIKVEKLKSLKKKNPAPRGTGGPTDPSHIPKSSEGDY